MRWLGSRCAGVRCSRTTLWNDMFQKGIITQEMFGKEVPNREKDLREEAVLVQDIGGKDE